MIQSILFFTLGFLCAAFLALMIVPAIWRRAVRLTRKRIEASVPLTLPEIQADKDRLRAEFAMSTRRLEMSLKAFREKASGQILEITRSREELRELAAERDRKNQALSELEARSAELRAELRRREDQLTRLSERLAEAERAIDSRAQELDKVGRLYEETSIVSSSRQIELVARESEVEKLSGEMSALEAERKEAERRYQELLAESRTMRDALRAEKKRAGDLEAKLTRTVTTLADREDKLEASEKEMARMRERAKDSGRLENDLHARLIELEGANLKLESEHASLTLQMTNLLGTAKGIDIETAIATLKAQRADADERMATLGAENARLRQEIAALERAKTEDWSDERRQGALLREQMNDLAAEVVKLTMALDGPESPIAKALSATPARIAAVNDAGSRSTSLADRVRALQNAAKTG